jgi:hypothetical protein
MIIPAAIAACAIAFGAGCVTEQTSPTIGPYASISDEARDPSSMPRSADANAGNSGGVMSTIGAAITWPFRTIAAAFETK